MNVLDWTETDDGDQVARFDGARWLLEVRRIDACGTPIERRSPDGEGLLIVLGGTHDLFAGSGSWVRRGTRPTPFDAGRPVAVFLPPGTSYRTENGEGQLVVVAVRQPAVPAADAPREALARKPLLQLAGSGKAFDPSSGTWKPEEAFLASAEAILPRRIERIAAPSGAMIERILPPDYKALGLCADEAVLAQGQCVCPPPPDAGHPGYPAEIAVFVVTQGEATVGEQIVRADDGPGVLHVDAAGPPRVEATAGSCYALFVYAGAKAST